MVPAMSLKLPSFLHPDPRIRRELVDLLYTSLPQVMAINVTSVTGAVALAVIRGDIGYAVVSFCIFVTAAVRIASLLRNAALVHKSTMQSAIGVRERSVRQVSQGFTAGAFNTKEFFHGRTFRQMQAVRFTFPLLAFVVPTVLLGMGIHLGSSGFLVGAFGVQYVGLILERWYFLADAQHPQNLYYARAA